MLPLDVMRKYYPNLSDDELKEIQEIVYLLACAVMQQFYGPLLDKLFWRFRTRERKANVNLFRFLLRYNIIGLNFEEF